MFTSFGQVASLGVPQFETRQALIIINVQNDSFDTNGQLPPCQPTDFADRIKALIPFYRKVGDIVWVRTEFEARSKTPSPPPTDLGASHQDSNEAEIQGTAKLTLDDELDDIDSIYSPSSPSTRITYYPTSRTRAMMRRASAKTRSDQRRTRLAMSGAEDINAYLAKPRKGQPPKLYQPRTHGADISDDCLPFVDEARDLIVTKNHYSAFDATPLLLSLRMKLVTNIHLCGCLSNVSIYATAADAVRHGFGVYVVEDCLGYRSENKHVDAMRQMADIMGVSGVDSEELIEETGGRAPPDTEVAMFSGPGSDGITILPLPLECHNPDSASNFVGSVNRIPTITNQNPGILPTALEGKVAFKQGTQQDNSERPLHPSDEDPVTPEAATLVEDSESEKNESVSRPVPGVNLPKQTRKPGDGIGEGDSSILHEVLTSSLSEEAFMLVRKEVDWQTMRHRSGEVPRLVAVQGEIDKDRSRPIYRHPADESPPLLAFTPAVSRIREEVQKLLGQPFNHALIQLYRGGHDNISEHSDKTLDITRGSNIVNVSLGAQRVMTLRTKRSVHNPSADNASTPRRSEHVSLPHGSMFVLGPKTNMRWLHGIRADKRPVKLKRDEETSFGGERISITFRHISTFTDEDERKIWGQGARSKTPSSAGSISTNSNAEMESLIIAFGKENQQADFDWDKEYGKGFDVINLVSSTAQLFLCEDEVANLRVLLSLSERDVPCKMIRGSPLESGIRKSKSGAKMTLSLSNTENPTFRDIDEDASEIVGDLAILFYLSRSYPILTPPGVSAKQLHRVTTQIFSRATQANDLLFLWRGLPRAPMSTAVTSASPLRRPSLERPAKPNMSSLEEFKGDMEVWEDYAGEAAYIGGDFYTMIDCAFWPVLNIIVQEWDGWSEKCYPCLAAYYRLVESRESVKRALAHTGR